MRLSCTILPTTLFLLSTRYCARRWSYRTEVGTPLSSHSGGDW